MTEPYDRFWAEYLGVKPTDWRVPGVSVSAHAGDPCMPTHPEYRGRACGTAVVSRTVELALAAGKLLLYQTLESNLAAVKLAQRLGYEQYAQHITGARLATSIEKAEEVQPKSWKGTSGATGNSGCEETRTPGRHPSRNRAPAHDLLVNFRCR